MGLFGIFFASTIFFVGVLWAIWNTHKHGSDSQSQVKLGALGKIILTQC